jgi:hypothetical protein
MSLEVHKTFVSTADEEHLRVLMSNRDLERHSKEDAVLWALADCRRESAHCNPKVKLADYSGFIGWINVCGESPMEYTFDGQDAPIRGFKIDLQGMPISAFPSEIHAVDLMMDIVRCRETREPLYHQIDQTMNGMRRFYRRLLAPFEDPAGRVKRVYYAVRWLAEPALVMTPS